MRPKINSKGKQSFYEMTHYQWILEMEAVILWSIYLKGKKKKVLNSKDFFAEHLQI